MTNRDVAGALKWLADQSKNPSQSWQGLCQSSCRQAYKMPAYGSSAKQAWANVEGKYKTKITNYKDDEFWATVPAGAILYSTAGTYGHAWIADSDETGWSVDYKRNGKIDRVPIRIPGWSSYYKATVGYITGAQYYADNKHIFKGLQTGYWDGKVPPLENVMAANDDRALASAAVWRLACRLSDLGYGNWKASPIKYTQTYPVKAVEAYNEKHGPNMPDKSQYGPKMHERLFGA